ncbi:ABC transporter permease [Nocardiopsis synnemataformans]|uniref:ABC transporter permease n=1 Tax=Nocardiopsis synnemataformans TaxID=61305 RepID=UPI003EB78BEF
MLRFIARRVGQGLVTIALLTVVVFLLSRATGDPLDSLVPVDASEEQREHVARQLGLDRPLWEQFLVYVGNLLRGDLGISFTHRVPVTELFAERIFNSLALVVPAFAIVVLVGPALGVIGATSRFSTVRRGVLILATLGIAMPVFWLGLVLVRIFAVELGWLPASRMGGWEHYVLPVTSLSLLLIAGMMRLVRSSMLESMGRDYVKLARIKGVSERSIRWKHALRNSLSSAVAFLSVYMSSLVAGTTVIEKVFAWPGVGLLLYDGVVARNYPLVQGVILISVVLVVAVNTVFDVLQAYLDPKVRLSGVS